MIDVEGFAPFWEGSVRRKGGVTLGMPQRIMLDALGLGLEQTLRRLAERPGLEEFSDWVLATAGPPDAERIARYHAHIANAPLPEATRARLAAIDAAPPVLGPDDLAHWDAHGYVIVREAIDRDAAAAIEAVLWEGIGARPDAPESWYGHGGIMLPIYQHPAMDVPRYSPRVHKAFAQLWGTADLWTRIDRLGFNPPERGGQSPSGLTLHWDVSLVLPIPFATQGVLYLTDTDADQGALQLVPGFHHRIEAWLSGLGDADPRAVDLSDQAVPIAANAGDLILWRHELPHSATRNRAARPRLVQYVNMYAPDMTIQPVWR